MRLHSSSSRARSCGSTKVNMTTPGSGLDMGEDAPELAFGPHQRPQVLDRVDVLELRRGRTRDGDAGLAGGVGDQVQVKAPHDVARVPRLRGRGRVFFNACLWKSRGQHGRRRYPTDYPQLAGSTNMQDRHSGDNGGVIGALPLRPRCPHVSQLAGTPRSSANRPLFHHRRRVPERPVPTRPTTGMNGIIPSSRPATSTILIYKGLIEDSLTKPGTRAEP